MTPGRRSNRGGPRTGTPGQTYTNRTDLNAHQPVATAPGQAYGAATRQADAQRAIPLPTAGATSAGMAPTTNQTGPLPGSLGQLHDPTQRPDEPVTHGLPSGPGGGPEVLNGPTTDDTLSGNLRGLYQLYPSSDLARLIADLDTRSH